MEFEFPRIKRLPPYVFNIIGDLRQQARRAGEDIIDFGMGNPDGETPPHVVAKLIEAAQKPQNHRYSVSRGVYKLRLAIVDWYRRRYGVELDADREAIVTIGSKDGLAHLAMAVLGPGDTVFCPSPTSVASGVPPLLVMKLPSVPLRPYRPEDAATIAPSVSSTIPRAKSRTSPGTRSYENSAAYRARPAVYAPWGRRWAAWSVSAEIT